MNPSIHEQSDQRMRALHGLLVKRGWTLDACEEPDQDGYPTSLGIGWAYPASYGGIRMNTVDTFTPDPLMCFFEFGTDDKPLTVDIAAAGNKDGCGEHTSITHVRPFDVLDDLQTIEALLTEVESAARDRDPRELIECWFFGECGRTLSH